MPSLRLSLNALRAFEATARLRSFSAAADELSVTHGAVSRQVRSLEDSLGLALLTRSAISIRPRWSDCWLMTTSRHRADP